LLINLGSLLPSNSLSPRCYKDSGGFFQAHVSSIVPAVPRSKNAPSRLPPPASRLRGRVSYSTAAPKIQVHPRAQCCGQAAIVGDPSVFTEAHRLRVSISAWARCISVWNRQPLQADGVSEKMARGRKGREAALLGTVTPLISTSWGPDSRPWPKISPAR
jgi:hypothetical protein